jgi:hypothetical protein
MVLELVLHSSEEILSEGVIAADASCRLKVVGHEAVWSILLDHRLCLMIASDNHGCQEPREEDGRDGDRKWKTEEPNIPDSDE